MNTTIKDTNENLHYTFDFSEDLNSTEIIATYEVQVSDVNLIDDSIDDTKISVNLSGGANNVTGEVTVIVNTDEANTYVDSLYITMIDSTDLCLSETQLVREYTGDTDPDAEIMADCEINTLLYQYKDLPTQNRIYNTVLASLLRMKSLYAHSAYRSRDRELSTEVEEYGKERYEAICGLLDYYKNNPDEIISNIAKAAVRIGGVRVDEYNRVALNPNGINGGAFINNREKTPVKRMTPPYRSWRTR